jgi:hypothetical protein
MSERSSGINQPIERGFKRWAAGTTPSSRIQIMIVSFLASQRGLRSGWPRFYDNRLLLFGPHHVSCINFGDICRVAPHDAEYSVRGIWIVWSRTSTRRNSRSSQSRLFMCIESAAFRRYVRKEISFTNGERIGVLSSRQCDICEVKLMNWLTTSL